MMRIVPALVDLVLVLLFAVVGRASHHDSLDPGGIWHTAWPFLAACLFGWLVLGLLDEDGYSWRSALIIWLVTLLGGMGLRISTGDSAAPAFVIVATLLLGLVLFGWRLVRRLVRRRTS